MPRGCQNKRPALSAVAWAARKAPSAATNGKLTAKPTTIQDQRSSQRLPLRRVEVAPEWAKLRKKDYESIPGTRIQSLPGGIAVRVITQDGTKFPPLKVLSAKRHLRKLARLAREKAEMAKLIDNKQQVSYGCVASADVEEAEALPTASAPLQATRQSPAAEAGSKKARKEAAWKERQQKLADLHSAKVLEDCREVLSEQSFEGEVVHRTQGKAWIKIREASQLPQHILSRLQADAAEIKSQLSVADGEVISVCFADVADTSLDLRPGAALQFKIFTSKHGVGGCDARSLGTKRPATQEAGSKKRAKTEQEPETAAKAEEVTVEGVAQ